MANQIYLNAQNFSQYRNKRSQWNQIGALGLVVNTIVVWNPHYKYSEIAVI